MENMATKPTPSWETCKYAVRIIGGIDPVIGRELRKKKVYYAEKENLGF